MRSLTRALQAPLCGVTINWGNFGGADVGGGGGGGGAATPKWVMQCPKECPPIYPGDRYFVYAIKVWHTKNTLFFLSFFKKCQNRPFFTDCGKICEK